MADKPRPEFRLQNGLLQYVNTDGKVLWDMYIDRIVLMAEFTTNQGPWLDDYFFVFWTFEDGKLYRAEASFYSDGRDEMLSALWKHWKIEPNVDLVSSTEWKSRVIWPQELADRPYFTLEELPPSGLRQKIRRSLFGPVLQYFPTEEVSNYLRRFKPDF